MGERLAHAAGLCSSPRGKAARTTASKGPSQRVQQSQVALTDNHTGTRNASLGERALPLQVSEFQTCFIRV